MTIAYVYKWTHTPSLNWYVGSRTAKNCHPEDGYISSSKIVKPMILSAPDEWERTIIETGDPLQMYQLEKEILVLFDAMNDKRSFNKNNGTRTTTGRKHTVEEIEKLKLKRKLQKILPFSAESKLKMRNAKLGIAHKTDTCSHCGISASVPNLARWHFEKCKTIGNQ